MRYCLVMILIHTVAVVFFVSSCQKDSSSESCLSEYIDSLMQVSPDSALLVLESIVHPENFQEKTGRIMQLYIPVYKINCVYAKRMIR